MVTNIKAANKPGNNTSIMKKGISSFNAHASDARLVIFSHIPQKTSEIKDIAEKKSAENRVEV